MRLPPPLLRVLALVVDLVRRHRPLRAIVATPRPLGGDARRRRQRRAD